jgi:hypothetical protein
VALGLSAQIDADLDRRLAELERKMKILDPTFVPAGEASLAQRLRALEARMDLALSEKSAAQPVAVAAVPPAAAPAMLDPVPVLPAAVRPAIPVQQASAAQQPAPSPFVQAAPPLQTVSITGDFQTLADTETRLPVSGYMDFHVNKEAGDAWRPDFHRFVLLFGHSFSSRIKFWSELEIEHAFVGGGEESGEVALEQAYLDFLITPKFNLRGGMLLTPVGIVNERHEPPSFNGVERPFVETTIIPTTWRELGFGVTGDLGRGFRYRGYVTSALDASFFNAESGISEGRSSGFDSSMRNPAAVGRLEFAGVRRLTIGTSLYSGLAGFNTPGVNPRVTIVNTDGRYSYRRMDFRALFAHTWVSRAGELNHLLRMQTGVNPNVASQMRGYYFEPAFHILPRRLRHDIIAFGRYERYDTQYKMPEGYLALNQFNRSSWVAGITYKPVPDVAVKFDYVFHRNRSRVVKALNGVNLGIGWWF